MYRQLFKTPVISSEKLEYERVICENLPDMIQYNTLTDVILKRLQSFSTLYISSGSSKIMDQISEKARFDCLTVLNISKCKMDEDVFINALRKLINLRSLIAPNAPCITSSALKAVGDVSKELVELNIANCKFIHQGLKYLCKRVKSTLAVLNISGISSWFSDDRM